MTTSRPRKLLYIAGPYTHSDPVENTHRAILCGMAIHEHSHRWTPMIPHLNLIAHMASPRPPRYWYDFDLELLEHCHAIVRLTGESIGADAEMVRAAELGLEVVEFEALPPQAVIAWLAPLYQ